MGDTLKIDGWGNLMTGLGIAERDKRKSVRFYRDGRMAQTELENLYAGDDIAARMVDAMPYDATREWIDLKSDDQAEDAILTALEVLGAKNKLRQAWIYARLFGGSVILLGIDDGQAVSEPLKWDSIKSIKFLTVLDRYSVSPGQPYSDPLSPKYGQPEYYTLQSQLGESSIPGDKSSFGVVIHESRLIRFDGIMTTPRRQLSNETWGESILARVFELLPDFATLYTGAAHLVNDFSQGVFKLKNLHAILAAGNESDVLRRLALIDQSRSLVRAIVLDADGEEFERQSASFAGLPELMDRFAKRLSSAARMPVSVLFGESPGGLGSTGDMEIRTWYDTVKAEQEAVLRPAIEKLIRALVLSRDGPTRGIEPEQWAFAFKPLWQMSDAEKAEIRLKQANTDQIYIQNMVVSPEDIANSRFGGDAYSVETTITESATDEQAA